MLLEAFVTSVKQWYLNYYYVSENKELEIPLWKKEKKI